MVTAQLQSNFVLKQLKSPAQLCPLLSGFLPIPVCRFSVNCSFLGFLCAMLERVTMAWSTTRDVVLGWDWDGERPELRISWCSSLLWLTDGPQRCWNSREILRNNILFQISSESSCALQNNCEMLWLEQKDKGKMLSAIV